MCFYLLPSTAWPWSSSGTPSAIPGREQQLPGGCSTRENLAPSHSAPGVLPEGLFPPLGAQQTAQHERFCCTSAEDCFFENLRRFFGGWFLVFFGWVSLFGFFFLIGKGSSVALQSSQELCGMWLHSLLGDDQEPNHWILLEEEDSQAGLKVWTKATGAPFCAILQLGCGWRVACHLSTHGEKSPEWTWERQHPSETLAVTATSALNAHLPGAAHPGCWQQRTPREAQSQKQKCSCFTFSVK